MNKEFELIFTKEDIEIIKARMEKDKIEGYIWPFYDYIIGDIEDLEKDITNFDAQMDLDILLS